MLLLIALPVVAACAVTGVWFYGLIFSLVFKLILPEDDTQRSAR